MRMSPQGNCLPWAEHGSEFGTMRKVNASRLSVGQRSDLAARCAHLFRLSTPL